MYLRKVKGIKKEAVTPIYICSHCNPFGIKALKFDCSGSHYCSIYSPVLLDFGFSTAYSNSVEEKGKIRHFILGKVLFKQ